jgi:protein MpaA
MQRLGKNINGYRGEGIDIQSVLEQIKLEAAKHGWQRDSLIIPSGAELVAYRKGNPAAEKRVYLSTGIHGDEPAGPLAILRLLRENHWPQDIGVWLCPCINLTGFPLNTRENAAGIDLNRDYRHFKSDETRVHASWLKEQPNFDIAVCLHEDWEANGFYVYELNPDKRPSLSEKIIQNVALVSPIESSDKVDGWEIQNGIIRPDVNPDERPQWPESIFLLTTKTRQAYTLESPSDFPIEIRVAGQIAAVRTVLQSI